MTREGIFLRHLKSQMLGVNGIYSTVFYASQVVVKMGSVDLEQWFSACRSQPLLQGLYIRYLHYYS